MNATLSAAPTSPHCTSLFCINEQHSEIVDIPLANFDDPIDRTPDGHYYLANRVSWLPLDESLPDRGP